MKEEKKNAERWLGNRKKNGIVIKCALMEGESNPVIMWDGALCVLKEKVALLLEKVGEKADEAGPEHKDCELM